MTNKRTIVKHLKLLYGKNIEDIVSITTVTFMDNCGSFKYWLKDACNEPYWEKFIESKLVHPDRDIPLPSQDNSTSNPSSSHPQTSPQWRNRLAGPGLPTNPWGLSCNTWTGLRRNWAWNQTSVFYKSNRAPPRQELTPTQRSNCKVSGTEWSSISTERHWQRRTPRQRGLRTTHKIKTTS